jgi:hypothetical protein
LTLAALAHQCVLLEDLHRHVQVGGNEMTGRVIARAHLEAVIVGLYLCYAGNDGMDYIEQAFKTTIERFNRVNAERDAQIRNERERVAKENERRRQHNAGIVASNERDGTSIPLRELVPEPEDIEIEMDLSRAVEQFSDVGDAEFNIDWMASEASRLARESGEQLTVVGSVIYAFAYRGLSTTGAHPTYGVLNGYLDARGMLHVQPTNSLAPFGAIMPRSGYVMTLINAHLLFGQLGVERSWFEERLAEVEADLGRSARGDIADA